MYNYAKVVSFIFDLCGNEFITQLLLIAFLYIPVFKKRKLFYVKYPLCLAAMIGLQTLKRFGYFPVPEPVNYVIVTAMLTGTELLCFEAKGMQALFISVCIYGGQHIISNLCYALIFLIMYTAGNTELFAYYFVIMPIVTAAGMVATYFLPVRIIKNKSELKFNNVIIYYIIIVFMFVASTLTHYARSAIYSELDGLVYLLLISSLFTCSSMLVGFMNLRKKQLEAENEILQELLRKDELRYEQAKLSNEKIQIKYHDMKQRTHQGIVNYESLKETEADDEILKSAYFTGNRALDVILSEKAMMCERLGIRLICTADGEAISFMRPHHIYSLVGNALENAIESLKGEQDTAMKEITVNIVRREGTCLFKTANYIKQSVEFSDGVPQTTKSDAENHGFGAKSMRNVVYGYGGHICFYEEDETFIVLAEMPIPE